MNADLFWPIVLMSLGLVLMIAEVFVPSGGMISVLAVGFLGVSAWQAFAISTAVGLKFLLALLVLVPSVIGLALYLWPRTPVAKSAFLKAPTAEEVAPERYGPPLAPLIGQYGRALTPLRPSGMVDFEGRRLDAIAEEGLIPAGALIRAVKVQGSRIIVRVADDAAVQPLLS
jgi:membrane-bound serine protease (ClpP class)